MSPLVLAVMDMVRSQIVDPAHTASDAFRADAALVHRLLTGADGAAFMDLMAKATVLRPALDPTLHGSASHDYAQRRTGENSIFATLVHLHDTHIKLSEGNLHDRRLERPDRPAPVFGWAAEPAAASDADDGPSGAAFDPGGAIAFRG